MTRPFCVGLTGGIGCGKSKAADRFAELGAIVIDTDLIARELTSAAGAAMPAILAEFGPEYVLRDGSLDRARMRELAFSAPNSRARLEAILHPLIRAIVYERLATAAAPYVILVVPLLLETDAYVDVVDRVLVVDCAEEQQIARTSRRSGLGASEVRRIMDAQLSRAERLHRADDVISNDSDISTLRDQVDALHGRYLLAAQDRS